MNIKEMAEKAKTLVESERGIGKTEMFARFRFELMQQINERYRRLHTKRDRYSAGSKRGRRR